MSAPKIASVSHATAPAAVAWWMLITMPMAASVNPAMAGSLRESVTRLER